MNCKILLGMILLLLVSCKEEYQIPKEISEIEMNVEVRRFDQDFHKTDVASFDKLKTKYPYFVPRSFMNVDSLWRVKKLDTLEVELLEESSRVFPDFKNEETDLELLFKHIKYYYPEFENPEVVALTSKVKYRSKILLQKNILLIAIDTYLGEDHKFYEGIPKYIAANLKKEQLVSDIAEVYAKRYIASNKKRTYVEQMVSFGKELYLKDLFMPFKSEASRIGYSEEQLAWAKANESEIWSYFVDRDLLLKPPTK